LGTIALQCPYSRPKLDITSKNEDAIFFALGFSSLTRPPSKKRQEIVTNFVDGTRRFAWASTQLLWLSKRYWEPILWQEGRDNFKLALDNKLKSEIEEILADHIQEATNFGNVINDSGCEIPQNILEWINKTQTHSRMHELFIAGSIAKSFCRSIFTNEQILFLESGVKNNEPNALKKKIITSKDSRTQEPDIQILIQIIKEQPNYHKIPLHELRGIIFKRLNEIKPRDSRYPEFLGRTLKFYRFAFGIGEKEITKKSMNSKIDTALIEIQRQEGELIWGLERHKAIRPRGTPVTEAPLRPNSSSPNIASPQDDRT
ncbi:hypothetical protein, partial [Pseudomonas aeruginosa]